MTETAIIVPREHDSFGEITLNGELLLIRFSYNDTFDYWTFGIYERNRTPILQGIKIIPNFPLNLFLPMRRLGDACFIVSSKQQRIGRRDFWDSNAQFMVVTK